MDKLQNLSIPDNYVLMSLDEKSLFTNVPLQLVTDSLKRRISSLNNCNIPFTDILKCTEILYNDTFFVFNKKYYRQVDGTPMGSPISPLFADIVIDDLESSCLKILKTQFNCSPLIYHRNVDDTILIVHKEHIDLIISVFNSYHNELQFTHEIQNNNQINFLDVTLNLINNRIISNWFQKPTASNRQSIK